MDPKPLLALVAVLVFLLVIIVRLRVHAFIALTLSGLALGLLFGMPIDVVVSGFLGGFGKTLEWIGFVIVAGAAIGEILSDTKASLSISRGILRFVGEKRLPAAMTASGYVISIPAFVDVAYIMMKPVTEALAARSRRPVLVVGLALSAGLTASHGLLPPTPGPLAAAGILGADLGRVVLINAVVAAFAATGGLIWAVFYCRRYWLPFDDQLQEQLGGDREVTKEELPGFLRSITPILLPLFLIAAGSFAGEGESLMASVLRTLGTPMIALLVGLFAAVVLLKRENWGAVAIEQGIRKSASVLMITAAGGGFAAVIKGAGVGEQLAQAFQAVQLPGLLFPFLVAATLTTATGSLTVSMITTSSLVAPLLPALGVSPEMSVALVGAGAVCVIHANSSFFWLLSRLHDVPPNVLYRTYSVQSLVMGCSGLLGALVLWLLGVR
jgi:GntP family gluconate:H+ symporter